MELSLATSPPVRDHFLMYPRGNAVAVVALVIAGCQAETKVLDDATSSPGASQAAKACAPGSYLADVDPRQCAPCPTGSFTAASGLSKCSPWTTCSAGTFVASPGTSTTDQTCAACPVGTTTYGTNLRACTTREDCPPGTTRSDAGTCTACAPGSVCSGGDAPAESCPPGTWDHDNNASTPCASFSNCTPGQFVTTSPTSERDRACTACPAGSFSTTVNAAQCTSWQNCMLNAFVASAGTATKDRVCATCPSGTSTYVLNASSCVPVDPTQCSAGWAVTSELGSSACAPCEPGTYCPGGMIPKEACAWGTWDDDSSASTPCVPWDPCLPGEVPGVDGSPTSDRSCTNNLDWRVATPETWPAFASSLTRTFRTAAVTDEFTVLDSSFSNAPAKFKGGVLMPDGRVFIVPFSSATAKIYDPATGAITTPPGTYCGNGANAGGRMLPDGRVFLFAHGCIARLYTPSTDAIDSVTWPGFPGWGYINGAPMMDGRMYMVPWYGAPTQAAIFDPKLSTVSLAGGSYSGISGRQGGAAMMADGRLIIGGAPPRIYDPVNDTLVTAFDSEAWMTGFLQPDGRVLFIGTPSRIYDPMTGAVTVLSGTHSYSLAYTDGCFLMPNGKYFCGVTTSSVALLYNPSADAWETGSSTLPAGILASGSHHGAVQLPDGRLLMIPHNGEKAFFYGGGGGFGIQTLLSPFFSRLL
jgi:hypothetical protein